MAVVNCRYVFSCHTNKATQKLTVDVWDLGDVRSKFSLLDRTSHHAIANDFSGFNADLTSRYSCFPLRGRLCTVSRDVAANCGRTGPWCFLTERWQEIVAACGFMGLLEQPTQGWYM